MGLLMFLERCFLLSANFDMYFSWDSFAFCNNLQKLVLILLYKCVFYLLHITSVNVAADSELLRAIWCFSEKFLFCKSEQNFWKKDL